MLSETIKEGQGPQMKGSVMLAVAESEEQVWEQLRLDPYAVEVWDMDKIQIMPVIKHSHRMWALNVNQLIKE